MRTLWAALVAVIAGTASALAGCSEDTVLLRGDWGSARFAVEVADDWPEVQRGLMFRESLPAMAGMLFVYPHPQRVAFWMKNTLIPLDMVFFGADGVARRVHEMARPLDETPIPGGDHIQYVLEINGGMASRLGIGPGTELQHPAVAPELAAWPCEEGQP